jgi:hypothetical protein
VAALIDTNVLVYRYDPRYPDKERQASELLRAGIAGDTIRVPHHALVELRSTRRISSTAVGTGWCA